MTFWLIGLVLAALGVLPVVLTLWRGRERGDAAPELGVYRDQLAEIDRDIARGIARRRRGRAHAGRGVAPAPGRRPRRAARRHARRRGRRGARAARRRWSLASGRRGRALCLARRAGLSRPADREAAGARPRSGARAARTRPRRRRSAQDALPAAGGARSRVRRPDGRGCATAMDEPRDDPQGWRLLARNEARLGNYPAARAGAGAAGGAPGRGRLCARSGRSWPSCWSSPRAGSSRPRRRRRSTRRWRATPATGGALYYKGLTYAQTGRPDLAFRIWRPLLETAPPDAPWIAPVRAQHRPRSRRWRGIDYERRPRPPAPAVPDRPPRTWRRRATWTPRRARR